MEELLQELFGLMPDGTFVDIEELQTFIEEDGTDELFDLFPPGTFEDEEQFNQYIEPLKKKDSPQVSPTQNMGLDTTTQEQTIPEDQSSSGLSSPLAGSLSDGLNVQNVTEDPVFIPENPVGTRYGANTQVGEKNTWLEEMVGKNTVTDFFGDMWRAAKQGVGQGATLDDALNLYTRGASISEDDLKEYMRVVENMDNVGMTDEMRDFNKIYEESGGGVLGFIKGVAFNPTVVNQLLISSIASMINPTVAAGAGAGALAGGVAGLGAGAIGGPLAAITGTGGAITGSLMGAGAALETGLSFTEFLKEAVEKKGLEFNDDGIRAVLEDPEALQGIRNKSAARGLVIGTIDGLTRGVAGKLGGASVKAAKAAGKQVSKKMATRAGLKAAGIEALGGSGGETAARAATNLDFVNLGTGGQEFDVAEIGFEGITGQASSVLSVPTAVTGTSLTDVARNVFKPAKYGTISKGGDVTYQSKADIEAMVDTMTDEEIRTAQFEIKNDPELSNRITLRKQSAQIDLDLPDFIQGEDRANLIALEQEAANMQDPKLAVNKKRKADINTQINEILDKYEGVMAESVEVTDADGKTTTNTVAITKDFAIEALENEGNTDASVEQIEAKQKEIFEQAKKDAAADLKATQEKSTQEGVENPTQEPVKENTDAVQESSTTQVDAQESAQDSQTVGEGDPTTNVSTESTEVESSTSPQAQTETEVNDAIDSRDPVKLKDVRNKLIEEKQEGSDSFNNVMDTIKEVAAEENVSVDEFLQAEQQVTADPQRVKNIAQDIKKKILGRRPKSINPAFIVKQVTEYLKGTKLAQQLNQVEYDALVREVSEDLGIQPPSRASITKGFKLAEQNNRMLGTINEGQNKTVPQKRVVVNERTALKDQIIMQAKAAKRAVKSYQSFLKNIAAEIKSLKKGGKLSPSQTSTLTERLAKVKPFVKESVDSYLAFVDKVMTDADFVAKITRAKKLKTRAKKNIKSKIGPVSNDLKVALNEVLGFNPSIIPDAQLDSYLQLMEEFGSTSAVLDLKQKSETMQQALDIINAVEAEVDVDENLSIDKEPTPDDYNVEEGVAGVKSVKISEKQLSEISDPRAREIARTLSELNNKEIKALAREKKDGTMDYSAIETLKKVKENIQNGYVPAAAMKLVNKVDINNRKIKVEPVIAKVKTESIYRNVKSAYQKLKSLRTDKSFILERVRSGPLFNIDDIFGNFNSKTIYNNTFGRLGKAFETYKSETKKEVAKVEAADKILEFDGVNKVRKKTRMGRSQNAIVKSKYKIRMLQLQREFLSNFKNNKPNKKAPSALEFVDATLKEIKNEGILSEKDGKILSELKEKFLDGDQLSLEKLEKSLTPAEKKALALYDEVNNGLAQKAVFVSTMHGNQVDLINNYNHHSVINTDGDATTDVANRAKDYVKTIDGTTKSKTIIERTDGPKAISFDPSYSAIRGVQQINMDYYMTQDLQQVGGLVNKIKTDLENNPNASRSSVMAANALTRSINEVVENVFMQSYSDATISDKALQEVKRIGYQSALASLPRAAAELVGNFGMMLSNPAKATRAMKSFGTFTSNPYNTETMFEALTALNSGVTSKLVDSDALTSKYSDMSDFVQPSRSSGQAVSQISNVMGAIMRFSGIKQTYTAVNEIGNKVLSYPDQVLSRPMWFGAFADSFAETTGIKLTAKDFKQIADGTSEYLGLDFKEAREAATEKADGSVVVMATSSNPFDGILKNTPKVNDSGLMQMYKLANSYMQRFTLFEYGTARHAIHALHTKGDLSKPEALGLLAGVTFRMSSYMVMYSMLTSLMDDELFDVKDDKREDDDLEDMMVRQLVGSSLGLITGGTLGNFAKIPINYMLEYGINEPLMSDFRKGEYDPFVHSMVFSQINQDDLMSGDILKTGAKIFAGPYGPLLKTLMRAGVIGSRLSSDTAKPETIAKYEKELEERLAVEALGNLGLLPFYKDIRRIILKDMFGKRPLTKEQQRAYDEYMEGRKIIGGDKTGGTKRKVLQRKQPIQKRSTKRKRRRLSTPLSKGLN
ncbi:MAG: hypothetical protein CMJ25_20710 [Phycisphaerae bacterium]|nr:hypothetical protein [Phycisphaerae bacterium]|tara:strand:+ start:12310 stop:18381 length:6072 start_codon:yes stop_codon:yes gene_type:complete